MAPFRSRLEAFVQVLRSLPTTRILELDIAPSVTEDEIRQVHERLGFELDERFLDYFRMANGWTIRWIDSHLEPTDPEARLLEMQETGGNYGVFRVAPLGTLFMQGPDPFFGEGSADFVPGTLGALDDATIRRHLRVLGTPCDIRPDYYTFVALFASPEFRDPVCLLGDDHGATFYDHRPVRARTFFECMLTTLGAEPREPFLAKEGSGDHGIMEIDADEFPNEPALRHDTDQSRKSYASDTLSYLYTQAGLPYQVHERPVRFHEETFAAKPRLTVPKVAEALKALGLFDVVEEENNYASLRAGTFGPNFRDCEYSVVLAPPYGKKSPDVKLTFRDSAPREALENIRGTLRALGLG